MSSQPNITIPSGTTQAFQAGHIYTIATFVSSDVAGVWDVTSRNMTTKEVTEERSYGVDEYARLVAQSAFGKPQ